MPYPAKHSVTNIDTGEEIVVDMDWSEIRQMRDMFLMDTDVWMLADRYASLTGSEQTELTAYRQALRDLPDDEGDSADAEFPDKPSFVD